MNLLEKYEETRKKNVELLGVFFSLQTEKKYASNETKTPIVLKNLTLSVFIAPLYCPLSFRNNESVFLYGIFWLYVCIEPAMRRIDSTCMPGLFIGFERL